jgi:hypothetical protein
MFGYYLEQYLGASGSLTLAPRNTVVIAGHDAVLRCNSSFGPSTIAWSGAGPVTLGCDNARSGYKASCTQEYNELTILHPTHPNTYFCSDSVFGGAKAAFVIVSKYL